MKRALLLVASVLALAGCGAREIDHSLAPPRRVEGATRYRPLDGLLDSPELQRLVELQIDRDGHALTESLNNPDARVRARAALALASVQDTGAVAELIRQLGDSVAVVRADVAHALGQTPTPAGAAALLAAALTEPDSSVRAVMIDAVGRAGGEAELWALGDAALVDARDGDQRTAAALALAYARFGMRGLHDQEGTDWIMSALSHYDRAVRQNAAYYFARSRDPQPWAHRRGELVEALATYGHGDRAAMHLLGALARLEDADDVPIFVEWLTTSPDWAIRTQAARALGQRTALDPARLSLIGALRDESHHVRNAAATALSSAPLTATEADSLIALLPRFEAEPPVFGALLRGLANAGRTDWAFERFSGTTDLRLRRAGMGALALVPGLRAFEALHEAAIGRDSVLATAAVEALVERRARDFEDASDERYFETFATALRTRDLAVSYAAAGALADSTFEPHGAGPLIQSVLLQMQAPVDSDAMAEMIRALGVLEDETAVPLLREFRASRSPDLRAAAATALAAISGEPAALPPSAPPPTRMIQWDWLQQWGPAPRIRFETERGTIVIELSVEQAPLTAQTMLTLASEGRFDGTPFHRVVPNFVIQGGDVSRGDGSGGPGFAIRSEFTRIPYLRGTVGMASSGKDTEGSQWFVTHSLQAHLDGRYTAFATLVEGVAVVDDIREGDRVIRATAEPTPR